MSPWQAQGYSRVAGFRVCNVSAARRRKSSSCEKVLWLSVHPSVDGLCIVSFSCDRG